MPTVSMPHMPHMPSIPGLRKANPTEEAAGGEAAPEQATEAQQAQTTEKDDDDRSRWVSVARVSRCSEGRRTISPSNLSTEKRLWKTL